MVELQFCRQRVQFTETIGLSRLQIRAPEGSERHG